MVASRRILAPPAPEAVQPLAEPPTFSAAIAAYQAADTVGAAVESALRQTMPPVDVVVCDDGSTDAIDEALAPYRDRIVLIRQPNRGEAAAKNAAAAAAGGDFVVFLDADDLWHDERLEALAELAVARPDLDVLTTNAELDVAGEIVGTYYPDVATFPVEDQAAGVIASDSAVFGAAAVRRSTFAAAGGLHEGLRSSDDWELWMRLVVAGSRIGLVDEPLYRYRLHERGTSADQVRGSRDNVDALERVLAVASPAAGEQAALERSLAEHRAIAELVAAEDALRSDPATGRAQAWAIARRRAVPPRTRAKALFAAAFPRAAARLLARRERRTGRSRTRKPIPGR